MKRLFVVLATVSLVAGAALVAVPGPAGAGGDSWTGGLVECDADEFGQEQFPDSVEPQVPVQEGVVWCAELTVVKDVDGDDPEVEFPIEVTCETVYQETEKGSPGSTEILDPGDEGDGPESETVELGDGESATFQIPVVTVWYLGVEVIAHAYRIVDCEVSEDVADADLPSGWECDLADIDPDDDVTFGPIGGDPAQSATIVVTNDCVAPPEPAATTTTTTTRPPAPPAPVAAAAVVAQPRVTG